jgi:hypothetical protein
MNPEFQRCLWLEFTPQRLVVMPLVQIFIFGLMIASRDSMPWESLGITAYWLALGLGGLWGTRVAAESVVGEVSEGTWDQQRLGSLSAWSMTWGKLFGSTVFIWYGCLPSLAVLLVTTAARAGPAEALFHTGVLVLMLVLAHAVALMGSLHAALRGTVLGHRAAFILQLGGLVALLPFAPVALDGYLDGFGGEAIWYGEPWPVQWMLSLSLVAFTCWALLGCHRLMSEELRLRNGPWAWLAFVLFCMAYAVGWRWDTGTGLDRALATAAQAPWVHSAAIATASALLLAYLALFAQPKDPVELRRLQAELARGQRTAAAASLPLWLCTLPLAAGAVLLAVLAGSAAEHLSLWVLLAGALAFFVRDAGLVMLLNLGPRRERADAAALLYLLLLYGLAPSLLGAFFALDTSGWLYPAYDGSLLSGLAPAMLQACVLWWLVYSRWTRVWG